ncbi:hypothetical protein C0993_002927, partial [Termitomyces sp. T159_Od127]
MNSMNPTNMHFWSGERSNLDPWQAIRHLDIKLADIFHESQKIARQLTHLETFVEDYHRKILSLIKSSQSDILDALKNFSSKTHTELSKSEFDISSASLPVPCFDEEHYPLVNYWYKSQYLNAKKEKKSVTILHHEPKPSGGNLMTWYVEDADGNPVDSHKVSQIRANARSVWFFLKDQGIAPPTWAEAHIGVLNYFEHHLCSRHPELAYGANNWKAHQVAINNYPSWVAFHLTRPPKIKTEVMQNVPLKRSSSPMSLKSSRPQKKSRISTPTTEDATLPPDTVVKPTANANNMKGKGPLKIKNPLSAVFANPTLVATAMIPGGSAVHAPSSSSQPPTLASTDPASISPTINTTTTTSASTMIATSSTASSSFGSPQLPPVVPNIGSTPQTSRILEGPAANAPKELSTMKKSKKASAGRANNAKSICKREWIKQNPTGMEHEFTEYWDSLDAESHQ